MSSPVSIKHLLILAGCLLIVNGFGMSFSSLYFQQEKCEIYESKYSDYSEDCWSPQLLLSAVQSLLPWMAVPVLAGAALVPYALIKGESIEVTGLYNSGVKVVTFALLLVLAATHAWMLFMAWGSNQYFIETRGCTQDYLASFPSESLKEQQEFCSVVIPVYNIDVMNFYVSLGLVLAWVVPFIVALHKGNSVPGFVRIDK